MKCVKFKFVIAFICIIFSYFVLLTKTKTRTKMKMKAKTQKDTSASVMEFFKDLLNEETEKKVEQFEQTNKKNSLHKSVQDNNALSAWLEISSASFSKIPKYPIIILPDGTKLKIQTDQDDFRINDSFTPSLEGDKFPATNKKFWFRLNGNIISYANNPDDFTMLGVFLIREVADKNFEGYINKDLNFKRFCFIIIDEKMREYTLCSDKNQIRHQWVCRIYQNLHMKAPQECTKDSFANADIPPVVLKQKIVQPFILIPQASRKCNEGWTYAFHGADWECACSQGMEQSPIDLPDQINAIESFITPMFVYNQVNAKSTFLTIDGEMKAQEYIKIKYFANALRIFHPNFGRVFTMDGALYHAEEIIFHTPAEHTIRGVRYDMEMEIIHNGKSEGDIAKKVVLSFLFKKKAGIYNKFLEDVEMFSLPNPAIPERDIKNDLYIPKVQYTCEEDGPVFLKPFSFYTYQGSLSFPPCSENTIRYVASEPIPLSGAIIALMSESLRKPDMKGEEMKNYRGVQPLNDRTVFYWEYTRYFEIPKMQKLLKQKPGHYEKVKKTSSEVFFVPGEKPSGLPETFVIGNKEAEDEVDQLSDIL